MLIRLHAESSAISRRTICLVSNGKVLPAQNHVRDTTVGQIIAGSNEAVHEENIENMLYSLQKEKGIWAMALQSERPLDTTDWNILRELQRDARLSYNELGRRVGLSAPATTERVRKLEEAGVIAGYSARIDQTKVGMPLLALIHLRCHKGSCILKTSRIEEFPEVLEAHKLSGSHCLLLKVALASMQHLDAFDHRLDAYGETQVHLITSSVITHRVLDWGQFDPDCESPVYPGWNGEAPTHER